MRNLRSGFLAVLATLGFSVLPASAASAAFELTTVPCGKEGAFSVNFCWEREGENELKELKGEEKFTVTLDEGEALLEIAGVGLHITCNEATGEGTAIQKEPLLLDYTLLNLELKFKGCNILLPFSKECTVPAAISTKLLKGDPINDTTELLEEEPITFSPEEGNILAEIEIKNNGTETCPVLFRGIHALTGKQQCLWIEPFVDLLEHLIHCLHTESLLKFLGKPASFELLVLFKFNSLSPDLWDVVELE